MCIFKISILNILSLIILLFATKISTNDIRYCSIHFVVDYPLWSLTYRTRANRDYFRTNTLLSSYIYRNVEGLNELYRQYRFPYTSKLTNITIQFFVHGITMITQTICNEQNEKSKNILHEFCKEEISSDRILDLVVQFSDYNKRTSDSESACLYYGITSRTLRLQNNKGIALGWSWRGRLCSDLEEITHWTPSPNKFNPRYLGSVGIVTTNFDATDYSLNKCEMTFFHEIGHSMNANHDNDIEYEHRKKECNPSDAQGGSYLMYASGTEGLLPNNRAYSHCSLDAISQFTQNLGKRYSDCLSISKKVKSKCDGTFSSDEVCDEYGTTASCCTSDCKLKSGAVCSPSTGSCCQYSCQYYPFGHECRQESECKLSIKCLGSSSICPEDDPSTFKANKTICGNGTLLCLNGLCELSICDLYSLLPCQLKQNKNELCMIACQQKDGSCVPFHTIDSKSDPSKPLYFPYGSSCNSNQGFCDKKHQCISLIFDENTNFVGAGISSLLLNDYSILLKKYWWIIFLFMIAQIILIPIALLHFRSQCIPSDNPFLQ